MVDADSVTIAEMRETQRFERYLRRVGKIMPALSARVFALRRTGYRGCGFHWHMERRLGSLIANVNDFENAELWHGKYALGRRSVIRICARSLFEDVAGAERSIDPNSKRTRDLRAARRREDGCLATEAA